MKDRERSRSRYRFCGHPVVFLLSGVRMAVQARGAAPPAMPNIIVILSDDFGWGSVILKMRKVPERFPERRWYALLLAAWLGAAYWALADDTPPMLPTRGAASSADFRACKENDASESSQESGVDTRSPVGRTDGNTVALLHPLEEVTEFDVGEAAMAVADLGASSKK